MVETDPLAREKRSFWIFFSVVLLIYFVSSGLAIYKASSHWVATLTWVASLTLTLLSVMAVTFYVRFLDDLRLRGPKGDLIKLLGGTKKGSRVLIVLPTWVVHPPGTTSEPDPPPPSPTQFGWKRFTLKIACSSSARITANVDKARNLALDKDVEAMKDIVSAFSDIGFGTPRFDFDSDFFEVNPNTGESLLKIKQESTLEKRLQNADCLVILGMCSNRLFSYLLQEHLTLKDSLTIDVKANGDGSAKTTVKGARFRLTHRDWVQNEDESPKPDATEEALVVFCRLRLGEKDRVVLFLGGLREQGTTLIGQAFKDSKFRKRLLNKSDDGAEHQSLCANSIFADYGVYHIGFKQDGSLTAVQRANFSGAIVQRAVESAARSPQALKSIRS
jgi:uncharacterized membrane protein YhaH (DUF805 family)